MNELYHDYFVRLLLSCVYINLLIWCIFCVHSIMPDEFDLLKNTALSMVEIGLLPNKYAYCCLFGRDLSFSGPLFSLAHIYYLINK